MAGRDDKIKVIIDFILENEINPEILNNSNRRFQEDSLANVLERLNLNENRINELTIRYQQILDEIQTRKFYELYNLALNANNRTQNAITIVDFLEDYQPTEININQEERERLDSWEQDQKSKLVFDTEALPWDQSLDNSIHNHSSNEEQKEEIQPPNFEEEYEQLHSLEQSKKIAYQNIGDFEKVKEPKKDVIPTELEQSEYAKVDPLYKHTPLISREDKITIILDAYYMNHEDIIHKGILEQISDRSFKEKLRITKKLNDPDAAVNRDIDGKIKFDSLNKQILLKSLDYDQLTVYYRIARREARSKREIIERTKLLNALFTEDIKSAKEKHRRDISVVNPYTGNYENIPEFQYDKLLEKKILTSNNTPKDSKENQPNNQSVDRVQPRVLKVKPTTVVDAGLPWDQDPSYYHSAKQEDDSKEPINPDENISQESISGPEETVGPKVFTALTNPKPVEEGKGKPEVQVQAEVEEPRTIWKRLLKIFKRENLSIADREKRKRGKRNKRFSVVKEILAVDVTSVKARARKLVFYKNGYKKLDDLVTDDIHSTTRSFKLDLVKPKLISLTYLTRYFKYVVERYADYNSRLINEIYESEPAKWFDSKSSRGRLIIIEATEGDLEKIAKAFLNAKDLDRILVVGLDADKKEQLKKLVLKAWETKISSIENSEEYRDKVLSALRNNAPELDSNSLADFDLEDLIGPHALLESTDISYENLVRFEPSFSSKLQEIFVYGDDNAMVNHLPSLASKSNVRQVTAVKRNTPTENDSPLWVGSFNDTVEDPIHLMTQSLDSRDILVEKVVGKNENLPPKNWLGKLKDFLWPGFDKDVIESKVANYTLSPSFEKLFEGYNLEEEDKAYLISIFTTRSLYPPNLSRSLYSSTVTKTQSGVNGAGAVVVGNALREGIIGRQVATAKGVVYAVISTMFDTANDGNLEDRDKMLSYKDTLENLFVIYHEEKKMDAERAYRLAVDGVIKLYNSVEKRDIIVKNQEKGEAARLYTLENANKTNRINRIAINLLLLSPLGVFFGAVAGPVGLGLAVASIATSIAFPIIGVSMFFIQLGLLSSSLLLQRDSNSDKLARWHRSSARAHAFYRTVQDRREHFQKEIIENLKRGGTLDEHLKAQNEKQLSINDDQSKFDHDVEKCNKELLKERESELRRRFEELFKTVYGQGVDVTSYVDVAMADYSLNNRSEAESQELPNTEKLTESKKTPGNGVEETKEGSIPGLEQISDIESESESDQGLISEPDVSKASENPKIVVEGKGESKTEAQAEVEEHRTIKERLLKLFKGQNLSKADKEKRKRGKRKKGFTIVTEILGDDVPLQEERDKKQAFYEEGYQEFDDLVTDDIYSTRSFKLDLVRPKLISLTYLKRHFKYVIERYANYNWGVINEGYESEPAKWFDSKSSRGRLIIIEATEGDLEKIAKAFLNAKDLDRILVVGLDADKKQQLKRLVLKAWKTKISSIENSQEYRDKVLSALRNKAPELDSNSLADFDLEDLIGPHALLESTDISYENLVRFEPSFSSKLQEITVYGDDNTMVNHLPSLASKSNVRQVTAIKRNTPTINDSPLWVGSFNDTVEDPIHLMTQSLDSRDILVEEVVGQNENLPPKNWLGKLKDFLWPGFDKDVIESKRANYTLNPSFENLFEGHNLDEEDKAYLIGIFTTRSLYPPNLSRSLYSSTVTKTQSGINGESALVVGNALREGIIGRQVATGKGIVFVVNATMFDTSNDENLEDRDKMLSYKDTLENLFVIYHEEKKMDAERAYRLAVDGVIKLYNSVEKRDIIVKNQEQGEATRLYTLENANKTHRTNRIGVNLLLLSPLGVFFGAVAGPVGLGLAIAGIATSIAFPIIGVSMFIVQLGLLSASLLLQRDANADKLARWHRSSARAHAFYRTVQDRREHFQKEIIENLKKGGTLDQHLQEQNDREPSINEDQSKFDHDVEECEKQLLEERKPWFEKKYEELLKITNRKRSDVTDEVDAEIDSPKERDKEVSKESTKQPDGVTETPENEEAKQEINVNNTTPDQYVNLGNVPVRRSGKLIPAKRILAIASRTPTSGKRTPRRRKNSNA